jgi:hypothetical protein
MSDGSDGEEIMLFAPTKAKSGTSDFISIIIQGD